MNLRKRGSTCETKFFFPNTTLTAIPHAVAHSPAHSHQPTRQDQIDGLQDLKIIDLVLTCGLVKGVGEVY